MAIDPFRRKQLGPPAESGGALALRGTPSVTAGGGDSSLGEGALGLRIFGVAAFRGNGPHIPRPKASLFEGGGTAKP